MDFQLVVLRGRSSAQAVRLADGITTVGRQDDCQLRIASAQVSRKHCQLFEHKGHLLVKDLGSSNGTYVNGQKVAQQRVLESGDELTIGPVKFRVEKRPQSAVQGKPARPAASGDTNVPAAAAAAAAAAPAPADDAPILGAPVSDGEEVQDLELLGDDSPLSLGDDDVFEIDFDDEAPGSDEDSAVQKAAPTSFGAPPPKPPSKPALPTRAEEPKHEPEGPQGDDAVADFLSSLHIDEE